MVYDSAALQRGQSLEPQLRASVSLAADCTKTCVTALSWLRDGRLAAGCDDGRIVSWDIPGTAQPADSATDATSQPQAAPAAPSAQPRSSSAPPDSAQSIAALRAPSVSPANIHLAEAAANVAQARSGFTYAQVFHSAFLSQLHPATSPDEISHWRQACCCPAAEVITWKPHCNAGAPATWGTKWCHLPSQ